MSMNVFLGRNEEILKKLGGKDVSIHFVGVGGVSMSALFSLSREFGLRVSGEDRTHGEYCDRLIDSGAQVSVGEHFLPPDCGMVVYSLAVDEHDATLRMARERGILTVSRAEYLGAFMKIYSEKIGISGTHGKSTVTAMVHNIFERCGKHPTTLCGADLYEMKSPCVIGTLDYIIYEGCEYKDAFLNFSPDISVMLNCEYEHTDYYKSEEQLVASFAAAANRAGKVVLNYDDENLRKAADAVSSKIIKVGKSEECDYRYTYGKKNGKLVYNIYCKDIHLGEGVLSMIGGFNAVNAVFACVCCIECGISFSDCARALKDFFGISRRLEYIGDYRGRKVYYDYAHHPTEIRAGIEAVKEHTGGEVAVIFGPHTYSRTKDLYRGFVESLSHAEYVALTEISGVRERVDSSVSVQRLAYDCRGCLCRESAEILDFVHRSNGALIIMGAINMDWVKKLLTKRY